MTRSQGGRRRPGPLPGEIPIRVVEIIVAGKPLAKGRVRFVRATGRAFTPERTVNYEGRLAAEAAVMMAGRPPVEGPVAVRLEVWLPIPASWSNKRQFEADIGLSRPTGKPDVDNYVKILDACNHIVWIDDSQVVELTAFKRFSHNPYLKITVDSIDPPVAK